MTFPAWCVCATAPVCGRHMEMPRVARKLLVVPNAPHHIVVRGNNRRRLFSHPGDYWQMVRYLDDALRQHEMPLHQLSLMPNHFHLITTPPSQEAMSDAMKVCLQRYATSRNRKKNASGRLFEQRFWSQACDSDDLAGYTLYNDANAYSAGLVDSPEDHKWSTCAIHYGMPERTNIPIGIWTPSTWYASLGADRAAQYRQYMLLFLDGRVPEWKYEKLRAAEQMTSLSYRQRIERPDGTTAR